MPTRLARAWSLPLLVLSMLLSATSSSAEPYAVVMATAEPAIEVDAAALRRLYLKEQAEWPDGSAARPIGRPATHPGHQAFLKQVLGIEQARLVRHWISLKQRTGQKRVVEVESDEQLAKLLLRLPGSFGVLPARFAEGRGELTILLRLEP